MCTHPDVSNVVEAISFLSRVSKLVNSFHLFRGVNSEDMHVFLVIYFHLEKTEMCIAILQKPHGLLTPVSDPPLDGSRCFRHAVRIGFLE